MNLGADVVMHSTTKYLSGHGSLVGGALVTRHDWIKNKLYDVMKDVGACPSPHDCWLLNMVMKTLSLRMDRHCANAMKVAEWIENHPMVERTYYPGLKSHAYYELARRTMTGFGGLVTFLVRDADWRQTADVVDAVRIPRIGPSLGGTESIIEQPMVMSYHDYNRDQRLAIGIPDNMIRVSCGIENPEDLIADLKQALDR